MKKYISPEINVIDINANDVIATSAGTETPWYEESDGIWDITVIP